MSQKSVIDEDDGRREAEAITQFIRGDEAGLDYLMPKYTPRLVYRLLRKFSTLTPQDAEEVVSETFFKALRAKNPYNPEIGSFGGWLYVRAERLAFTLLKQQQGERATPLKEALYEHRLKGVNAEAVEEPSPEMEELLNLLPEKRAEVVRLYYYGGNSVAAVAMLLNVQEASVRGQLSRAHDDIRKHLKG